MPVLDPERSTRSALRYRPVASDNRAWPAPVTARARRSRPDVSLTTAPVAPDDLDLEEQAPGRRTSSPTRRSAPAPSRAWRMHPLFFIGLGVMLAVLLWIGTSWLMNWGRNEYNTLVYGSPRTFQIDAVVGGGDSPQHPSHFVALNLHGQVIVLEFPAGDPSRVRVLARISVFGSDPDLAVVTLTFVDVGHRGQPDLLLSVDGEESVLVFSRVEPMLLSNNPLVFSPKWV